MATKQYIGARYVPKFAEPIEWVKENSYEALTIVTYLNNSYTSKKTVPANIEITNTEYWTVTGNYNAQVEQYRQETEKNNERVEEYKKETEKNSNEIGNLTNLKTSVKTNIVEAINSLDDDYYIIVSDSYGGTPSETESWCHKMKNYLNLDDSHCYITYKAGYGFAPAHYYAPFIDLVTPGKITESVPSNIEREKITKIVVGGGFNDRSTEISTLENAINDFITYCKTEYPNATVYLAAIGWSFNSEFLSELTKGRYITAYKNASKFGGCFLNGCEFIMHNSSYFQEDTATKSLILTKQYVHPNDGGSSAIATGIINALKTGSCNVKYDYTTTGTELLPNTTITQGGFGSAQMLDGNSIYIHWNRGVIKHTDDSVFNINNTNVNFIPLYTVTGGYLNCGSSELNIPCTVFLAGGSLNENYLVPAFITFKNGQLGLSLTNGKAITCDTIWLYPGSGLVPAFAY